MRVKEGATAEGGVGEIVALNAAAGEASADREQGPRFKLLENRVPRGRRNARSGRRPLHAMPRAAAGRGRAATLWEETRP